MKNFKTACTKNDTFKLPCLVGFSFVLVGMLCLATKASATTYECLTSNTLIEITASEEDCTDCPPPPDCPPVLACDTGYSCQPDGVEPPPVGEEQQYPPERAAAWVVSLGCTGLTDVPLDDSRWGERQEGEVYAQEGKDCLSLYWPSGGNALFDLSSVVTNPARWNDYLLSDNRPPHGGGYTIGTGKEAIRFNDGGSGGMTVFKSEEDTQPPPVVGQCREFLKEYVNVEQSKLPVHRIYPMGQRMMKAAWGSQTVSRVADIARNGFSTGGPNWNPSTELLPVTMEAYKKYNIRGAFRVTHGASMASELYAKMDGGAKEAQLFLQARSSFKRILNNPDWNAQVDFWLTGTEELSVRMLTTKQREQGLRYLKTMHEIKNELDSQKRPLWMSDVTGTPMSKMLVTHKYLGMVGPQNYLDKCCVDVGYKTDAVIGGHAKRVKATALALDKQYPKQWPHIATLSHGLLYTPLSQARIDNMHKIIPYWVFTSLNEGLQGYQVYNWYSHYTTITSEARNNGQAAYRAATKLLTDSGMDYAYLWGSKRKDLSLKITAGSSTVHGEPTVSMANIQYGKDRYLIITNGDDEKSVSVNVSGFPEDCETLKDLTTGKTTSLGTSISPILKPLDVKIFKISN